MIYSYRLTINKIASDTSFFRISEFTRDQYTAHKHFT